MKYWILMLLLTVTSGKIVQSRYATNGDNALFGYSYGGVFADYVLFAHPELFHTILIGALGNGGGALTSLTTSAQQYFRTHSSLDCNVFAGVGAYEPEKSANVRQFGAYLRTRKIKKLRYQIMIVPGVAHGAGLGPVLQNALKFAYCQLHQAITLPATTLQSYTGRYRSVEHPNLPLRLFVKNNQLYLQVGHIKVLHFLPYALNKFFMVEDERTEMQCEPIS